MSTLNLFRVTAIVFICSVVINFGSGYKISDQCIHCVCDAASRCDKRTGCTLEGVCGPFRLTRPFWEDGGMIHLKGQDPADPKAFEDCAKNVDCASETIRAYAKRYAKDCDGNGKINCYDYIRIHELGPESEACNNTRVEKSGFYINAKVCIRKYKE